MKKVPWVGFALVIVLLASQAAPAAILSPVRLVYASPQVNGDWHDLDYWTDLAVHVDNMDGEPGSWTVSVRYHTWPGGVLLPGQDYDWQTMRMILSADGGTHRLYTAILPDSKASFEIIAVRRYVDSRTGRVMTDTYRDNNAGAYYKVSAFGRSVTTTAGAVGGNVGLVMARNYSRLGPSRPGGSLYNQYFEAEIVVPNGAASRIAWIRMSTDGGAHWENVSVSEWHVFTHGDEDLAWGRIERRIGTLVTKPNKTVKFRVYFRDPVSGQTSLDDNFSQDYTVGPGETVQ